MALKTQNVSFVDTDANIIDEDSEEENENIKYVFFTEKQEYTHPGDEFYHLLDEIADSDYESEPESEEVDSHISSSDPEIKYFF
eukprot:CAMPEP_0117880536 /NCGR_PEP_ID=MMETSP0950-20121206/16229_1 /TAXON_ID=44440 /ORGANISM="Chattonella subsalsa, Strain CCMP2191" /LENGTH=83 /DNA_ID=CAMNT_0005735503 /DNA_START=899 /DNA_END=1150 /DNA_ORIENTATION=-